MRNIGDPDSIAWDATPPTAHSKRRPIVRAQAKNTIFLTLLDGRYEGAWVHNIDKRDTPCLGAHCPHRAGRHHLDARRKLYHACWDARYSREVLAEFTAEALDSWITEGRPVCEPVRGCTFVLSRRGSYPQAPVQIEYRPCEIIVEELPKPFDIRSALLRLWMSDSRPVDQFGFPAEQPPPK